MSETGAARALVVAASRDILAAADDVERYDVETVRSGRAALRAIDGGVDALVVETSLPNREASELLETVRERGYAVRAAVVVAGEDDAEPTASFPAFDICLGPSPTAAEIERAIGRLHSLRQYDDRIDRLYELAREQSRLGAAARPVGDGGFDGVNEALVDAREAADSALADVPEDDRPRLFFGADATTDDHESDTDRDTNADTDNRDGDSR